MKLHIATDRLSRQMIDAGVGRVMFKTKIFDKDVDVYFVTDVGCDVLFFVDPEEKMQFFYLKSEEKNNLYTIPIEHFYRMSNYFTYELEICKYTSASFLIAKQKCADMIINNINKWVKNFTVPKYKNTSMVDYTTLPQLILGKQNKGKYFYTVKKAKMRPASYIKSCLAFGKEVTDMLRKQDKTPNWIDEPKKENIDKLSNFLADEQWFDKIVIEDAVRFVKFKN